MVSHPDIDHAGAVLRHGDCLPLLAGLPECSVDAIVTDPPYGLGFMGREWDDLPPGLPWARQCLRVLKPGGHLLAFGGTRTWHRLACAVEDAGFEMRDSIAWLYGSGFPKSLDVGKAIDRAAGATREVIGEYTAPDGKGRGELSSFGVNGMYRWGDTWHRFEDLPPHAQQYVKGGGRNDDGMVRAVTAPATPAARQWHGWGTALKPAFEPIVVARKPLAGTVAATVQQWGTGALNIDGCRIDAGGEAYSPATYSGRNAFLLGGYGSVEQLRAAATTDEPTPDGKNRARAVLVKYEEWTGKPVEQPTGRWPTNVALDQHTADALDQQTGTLTSGANPIRRGSDGDRQAYGEFRGQQACDAPRGVDSGGASRFYPVFRYQAKAPASERPKIDGTAHPTCKPLELMRWLVRLVTPPGGLVLDPFAGSGTTGEAALLEGFRCLLYEREADYLPLIVARIRRAGLVQLGEDEEVPA